MMRGRLLLLFEHVYFSACLVLGRVLRASRYSKTSVESVNARGERQVRKHRVFYAPPLIWVGAGLMRLLDTGVRVLPRREWEERERLIYRRIHGASADSVRRDAGGTLILPWLAGETLASLLEDPAIAESARNQMIERAVASLAGFHRLGWTHGDAMAENVMIDVDAGMARWFDFETIHESTRSRHPGPAPWQRADDLRALLTTCLIRTTPERRAETVRLVLDVYADEGVTRLLAESFSAILRRPLTFHLAQAPLSIESYREIARLLNEAPGRFILES